nr:MAG TPA: hypothetical protein [Caudoviricetes sp.]
MNLSRSQRNKKSLKSFGKFLLRCKGLTALYI